MENDLIDATQEQVCVSHYIYIEREQRLTDIESLVLMQVRDGVSGKISQCVAIAVHPHNKPVSFRVAETPTKIPAAKAFALRAMFNGRSANSCVDLKGGVSFEHSVIQIVDNPF